MKRTIVGLVVPLLLFFGTIHFYFVPIQAEEEEKTAKTVENEAVEPSETKSSEKDDGRFTASFQGRVIDGDGNPISGLGIFASIDPSPVVRRFRNAANGEIDGQMIGAVSSRGRIMTGRFSTDEDGRFEFKVPEDGEARIFFTSEDYPPTTVKPEGRGDLGDIVLKTDSALHPTVRVLSPDGKPVPDVWVLLTPTSHEAPLARCAKTDEDGTGRFKPMLPGEYFLTVSKKPAVIPPVKESLDVPYAFPKTDVALDKESTEFTLRAVESSEITIRFADKRDIFAPEFRRESWPHQIVLADRRDVLGWNLRFHDGEALGDGAYRFRVPRDMSIELRTFQRGGEYNYRIGNETEFHRLPLDRLFLGKIDGNLNGDMEIELVDLKSPKLTLRAVDGDGKAIPEFWAYCVYPEDENDPAVEQIDGVWRLKNGALVRMTHDLAKPEWTSILRSSSNFSLDPETGKGTVDRIRPDEKLLVLLFDTKFRQGFLDLNLKSGVEVSRTVVLKTGSLPVFDRPRPVLRGRFVDEQGNAVPHVKIRITAEKPVAFRQNAYDRFYHRTTADAEGRFSCELFAEGEASVMATPSEHAAVHRLFEIADEKTADVGDIVLKKGIRPVVRVLDPDGKPRPDVLIGVTMVPEPEKNSKETEGFYCASERKDEVPVLPMLLPGKYRFVVNEYRPKNAENAVHYPIQSVDITPESFEVEIRGKDVSNKSVFPTAGRVVDEQGNPVDGANVMIRFDKPAKYRQYRGDRFMGRGTADPDGRFTVRYFDLTGAGEVREGKMSVSVNIRNDAESPWAPKTFETEIGSSLDNIVLEKGIRPTIRVLTSDGRPVSGVYVNMAGSKLPMWFVEARVPTDEAGRVMLPAVPPGSCRLMLGGRVNEEALKSVFCVFPTTWTELLEDTPELEYRGVEAVSLTLRFSDKIRPEKQSWLHLSAHIEDKESWFSGMDNIESLGDGVYRVEKVPKDRPLSFRLDIDDDWVYSYASPDMEKALPASNPEFGKLERDTELRIIRRKAARAEIRCVDDSGRDIKEFFVIGIYPDHPLEDYFKLEQVDDRWRIEKNDFDKRFLATKSIDLYDFALPFRMTSRVEFDWNAEKRQGRVLRIQPDEKVVLIAFDKTGRQGSVETIFSEGEERTVLLELE